MNVLLICQCDKRALTQTRRILDQFAERRGDRTWQTPITQAGLDTLRKLLRKTARKNTAVACHWIRGRDHSELLWIVGDASRFNAEGAVPTNATARDVLRRKGENDWHSQQDIYLLSAMAALLHDIGKACRAFQNRLTAKQGEARVRNLYRHEWISLRLFQAFVGDADNDAEWLKRLISPTAADDARWRARLQRDGVDASAAALKPFATLPPIAQAVGWLVLTHHRLPLMPGKDTNGDDLWLGAKLRDFRGEQLHEVLKAIDARWNELPTSSDPAAIAPYWTLPAYLPMHTGAWRKRAAKLAQRLLTRSQLSPLARLIDDPYVMHLSRLGLMLADHHYSSLRDTQDRVAGEKAYPLYANTDRDTGELCQPLDEHLLGVALHAGAIAHALPDFERHLPRLARHKGLRKRSRDERFRWQDRAADTAAGMRHFAAAQGAFIVNMASTGCGKTLANARIMNALADPQRGLRCAFALGLRTLTLQTGHSFRENLQLSDDELAIQVGGAPNRQLFEYYEQLAERSGSASRQPLLPEDGHVYYEGNDQHPLLQRLVLEPHARKLLAAPLLVCTIDHLTPATESQRGGRQIAPMLRLMSSDLVLDEPDDFDIDDLPALTRLVHWAGLLGSRVLLSSATLPPALVEGLFQAYLQGRSWFQRNRGERPGEAANVCCAWFDEFSQARQDCANTEGFRSEHLNFVWKRHQHLGEASVCRRGELLPLDFSTRDKHERREQFASKVRDAALRLHAQHGDLDPRSGKRISFGLVRMANIDPLFDVALALYRQGVPHGFRIHLCVYHSQFPLLTRSAIEYRLDAALNRRDPAAVFELPDIRQRIDASPEPDQLFIVLGSPVTEVGRDHDYDWAVVEPSSVRSMIQLAGRIRRHRAGPVESSNLLLFDSNLRHFENKDRAAYCKPGFERDEGEFRLNTHRLQQLLDEGEYKVIDARPRIFPRSDDALRPQERLVDLEHVRLQRQMLPQAKGPPLSERQIRSGATPRRDFNAASHWCEPQATLTGLCAQQQPFRYEPKRKLDLVLLPNDDEDGYQLHYLAEGKRRWEKRYVPIDGKAHYLEDAAVQGERIAAWGDVDFLQALSEQAAALGLSWTDCARRFATVSLPDATQGWRFHPVLGFTRAP